MAQNYFRKNAQIVGFEAAELNSDGNLSHQKPSSSLRTSNMDAHRRFRRLQPHPARLAFILSSSVSVCRL